MAELSMSAMRCVDQACDSFDRSCRDGLRPRIEDYLAGVEAAVRLILCTELIQLELEWRCRRGESPSLSDYQERFPECAGLFSVWLGEAREAAAAVAAVRKAPAAEV